MDSQIHSEQEQTKMQHFKRFALIAAACGTLAACGDTALEQGLLGAGAGAGAAIVTGGNATTGALIGAAGNVAYCQANPGKCS